MMKLVVVALLAVFAVSNARFIAGEYNDIENNSIVKLERESRVLLKVPSIGSIIYKSFKIVWFLLSTFCSFIDYKLAALAVAVNIGFYLFSNSYPVVLGAVLMFGFCKLTGLCSHGYALDKVDPLSYAANNLHLGALKYEEKF